MVKCRICEKKCTTARGLSLHIKTHKINPKEYYDKFLKKEGEGICPECGKETRFKGLGKGYHVHCSYVCVGISDKVKKKIKQTCLKKYGVENPSQSNSIKEKKARTCLKHYGVENPSQSKKIIEKKKQTCLSNFGVEYPAQSDEIMKKQKQTLLNNYGVEFSLQSAEIMKKQKQTNLKRYGIENPSNLKKFKEKAKQTNLERYGVENPLQLNEIKNKAKKTILEKYGVENLNHLHITNFDKWEDVKFIKENFLTDKSTVKSKEMMRFFNIKSQSNVYLRLKALNIQYTRMSGTSRYEQEICEFLRFELGILNVIQNDRQLIKPLELDFFLPDFSFAIEFNGMYWHSEEYKDKNYHSNKTLLCKKQGVELLHIWEDKWLENKEVFKQLLKNKLHKTPNSSA